jgi:hypothetical protein
MPVSPLKDLLFCGHVENGGGEMNDFGRLGGHKWSTVTGMGSAHDENEEKEESIRGNQHD